MADRIRPADWRRVVQYASAEAIQAYLDTALADRRRIDLQIGRLERLKADRAAQIEAGTWPTPEDGDR